jgi:phage shock protein A
MNLLTRLRHLLNASLNDLLDGLENPQTMINQLIRDLDAAILATRRDVTAALAQRQLLDQRHARTAADIDRWQDHAALAVANQRDDLARQALARKHDLQGAQAALTAQLAAADAALAELRANLHTLEEKTQEARRKRDTLLAQQRATAAPPDIIAGFDHFTRLEEQLHRTQATAARPDHDLEQQLDDLHRQQTLDHELTKLKSRKH